MRAENLIWIGEPSEPYNKRLAMWPRWTIWPYRMKYDGVECPSVFYMDEGAHEVYLAEKAILDYISHSWSVDDKVSILLKLIEEYGDKREEKGRSDVRDDWAESRSGESV